VKHFCVGLALITSLAFSQTVPPETVVATVNGKKITAKELEDFAKGLPPNLQQYYNQDKEGFLKQYSVLLKISDLAKEAKIVEQAPFKQRYEFTLMQLLSQFYVENYRNNIQVTEADQKAFYESHKDDYTQAKLQIILVGYSATAAKAGEAPKLTEEQALAKATDLVKQIKAGADFQKLVAANSDDAASKAKNGDFGTIRKSDQVPPELKTAIFNLKSGEVSAPVKQPNGFYIFRVAEYSAQPYEEVKPLMLSQLKDTKFQDWMKTTQDSAQATVENKEFFGGAPKPAAPPAAIAAPATPKKP
jgi:peptidyl-prolyl cis-trans isomerase C